MRAVLQYNMQAGGYVLFLLASGASLLPVISVTNAPARKRGAYLFVPVNSYVDCRKCPTDASSSPLEQPTQDVEEDKSCQQYQKEFDDCLRNVAGIASQYVTNEALRFY